MLEERSIVEHREYQERIISKIAECYADLKNIIVELDCGLGKRVLMYLILSSFFKLNTIVLLQNTSSLFETETFFRDKYKLSRSFDVVSSRTSPYKRIKILESTNVILATPQTLANALAKTPDFGSRFHLLIINEVDKLVRRTAYGRTLVYPYPQLLRFFTNPWIIGMTGTLRDTHLIVQDDNYRFQKEADTLQSELNISKILSMDEIMRGTDLHDFINYTELSGFAVIDPPIQRVFSKLDEMINTVRIEIEKELEEEDPSFLEPEVRGTIPLILDRLPVQSKLKTRYSGLLMLRKYLSGMLPSRSRRFLRRIKKDLGDELWEGIPKDGQLRRIGCLLKLVPKNDQSKGVILCSYVDTAEFICDLFSNNGYHSYLVTGRVSDKNAVIEAFRQTSPPAVLVLTSVGERDLDIPEANVLIAYDSINTVKTMYQRFKRTRGGKVVCLYYNETSEARKIARLLNNIKEKYPWSVK